MPRRKKDKEPHPLRSMHTHGLVRCENGHESARLTEDRDTEGRKLLRARCTECNLGALYARCSACGEIHQVEEVEFAGGGVDYVCPRAAARGPDPEYMHAGDEPIHGEDF